MSSSSSTFKNKLDSLDNTQESIVSLSQWVLFHQKHCQEIARVWSEYTNQDSITSSKRLTLLYLCNDVVQQARRKNKLEFNKEFAKVLPAALSKSYSELKPKIDRLLTVWQDRKIFSTNEISEMKKVLGQSSTSTTSKASTSSLSVSGDKIAPELKHVNELFIHLSKLTDISQGNLTQMGVQSKNYLNPQDSDNLPQPSVYISKLNLLEKLGKVCINNIDEIKKTRLLIKSQLDTLSNLIIDGTKTDDSKIGVINEKLSKLTEIRDELTDTTTTSTTNNSTFNVDDDNDDVNNDEDDMPAYDAASDSESDDDDDDEDDSKSRKRKMSQTPSGGSTPSKKVAFSEDIRVYDQPDDKQSSDDQQSQTNDNEEAEGEQQSDVFSLLSKLAD